MVRFLFFSKRNTKSCQTLAPQKMLWLSLFGSPVFGFSSPRICFFEKSFFFEIYFLLVRNKALMNFLLVRNNIIVSDVQKALTSCWSSTIHGRKSFFVEIIVFFVEKKTKKRQPNFFFGNIFDDSRYKDLPFFL